MTDTHDTNLPDKAVELEEDKKTAEVSEPATTETSAEATLTDKPAESVQKLTKEEILNKLKEIATDVENAAKSEIDSLKQAFYKLHNSEQEAAKKLFVENGGIIEEFVPQADALEEEFKNTMSVIKEKRSALNAEQEKQKELNLQIKLSIIEELKELVESPEDANKNYTEFKKLQQQWNEVKVVPCFGKSGYFMPRCICQCQREAEEQRKAAEERQRRMERIKRRKAQGLQDRYLYDYTFSNDNGQNPLMDKAHAYVENWKEAYKSNIGLLLFGDVGTGKSFFAGCIANALLDQDVPVLMTNFPTILNRLTGMFAEDRSEFIASFDEYDLLIIDDLGVERSTEYAMEQMFFVIDSRYRSRRPMIITTNLKLSELKNPPDLAHARIYDRILERCAPILFDGKNFREENAGVTLQAAKDIVNSKHD